MPAGAGAGGALSVWRPAKGWPVTAGTAACLQAKAAGEQHREELKAAKKEAEDLQKKASGRGWVGGE